jgi:hypothetical protein
MPQRPVLATGCPKSFTGSLAADQLYMVCPFPNLHNTPATPQTDPSGDSTFIIKYSDIMGF